MSDAPYQKECSFCKNKITMSKQSGSWLPYELNSDKKHDCRKKEPTNNNTNKEQFDHNDLRTLEHVLAELKLLGIEIDVDKLLGKKKESEYIK